jgi:hypothetical protein
MTKSFLYLGFKQLRLDCPAGSSLSFFEFFHEKSSLAQIGWILVPYEAQVAGSECGFPAM